MSQYQSTPIRIIDQKSFRIRLKVGILLLIFAAFGMGVSAQSAQVSQIPLTGTGVLIAVSPDSTMIAAAENGILHSYLVDPQTLPIQLIDLSTGSAVGQLSGATDYASSLTFSADGKTLASYHDNGVIYLWDIASQSMKGSFVVGGPQPGRIIKFLPDGQHIVMTEGTLLSIITIWDTATGSMVKTLVPHFNSYQEYMQFMDAEHSRDDALIALDVSLDGKYLTAVTARDNVWLWDLSSYSGQLIVNSGSTVPLVSIRAISFSSDDSQIIYFDQQTKLLHVWNVATSSEPSPIPLDADVAVVSPDGQLIAWAKTGGDSLAFQRVSDAISVTTAPIPGGIPRAALSLTFTPDGKNVLVNGTNGLQAVLDLVPVPTS